MSDVEWVRVWICGVSCGAGIMFGKSGTWGCGHDIPCQVKALKSGLSLSFRVSGSGYELLEIG